MTKKVIPAFFSCCHKGIEREKKAQKNLSPPPQTGFIIRALGSLRGVI
jgi:hypothetical protein